MRVVAALLWLRWREARHALGLGGRRDALERLSRAVGAVLPAVVVLFTAPGMLAVGAGGFVLGRAMADAGTAHLGEGLATFALRVGLLFWVLVLLVTPVVRSARGGDDERRFLLLPVGHGALHRARVLARAADPWTLLVLPGLAALPAGLAAGGAPVAALLAAAAGAALAGFVLAWGHCASVAVAALFRDRRRAEWVLVGAAALFAAGATFLGFVDDGRDGRRVSIRATVEEGGGAHENLDTMLPGDARWFPSELWLRALADGVGGARGAAATAVAMLVALAVVPYLAGGRLQRRLFEQPATSGTRRRGARVREPAVPRVPGLAPAVVAVAWAEVRSALRTVRGKTGVYLNAPILACLFLLVRLRFAPEMAESFRSVLGIWAASASCAITLVSLQPILVNPFASLGAGWVLEMLAPLGPRDLVRGKIAAAAALWGLATVPCLALALLMLPSGPPLLWLALVPAGAALFALLVPAGIALGAVLPKQADLNRLGKAGNPHGLASLAGTLGAFAATGAVSAAWFLPWLLWRSPAISLAASTALAGVAAAIGWLTARAAESLVARRSENLTLVATRT